MKTLCSKLFLLFICSQSALGQKKLDFKEIPVVVFTDSLAQNDSLIYNTITQEQFLHYKIKSKQKSKFKTDTTITENSDGSFTLKTDSSYYEFSGNPNSINTFKYIGTIPVINSHIIGYWGESIYEIYLLDIEKDIKMKIPSSYDSGPHDLLISPTGRQMIVFSTYDSPEYFDYYSQRSELFLFTIEKGNGLKGIKLSRYVTNNEWSIEEVIWINDKSIALKVYRESRSSDESKINYIYLKAKI